MLNPNTYRGSSDYEHTESVLAELTPDPESFKKYVYPSEDVDSDVRQLKTFKDTPLYKNSGERTDAKLLEKTFIDMLANMKLMATTQIFRLYLRSLPPK